MHPTIALLVPLFARSCHGGLFGAGSGSGGYEVVGPRLETFPNGATVPVEEPAVAAARANHLAAVAAARGGLNVTRREGFKILESEYGKSGVKILHLVKHGAVHTIQELEVESLLPLATSKDYERGDNSHIFATDTQKNTIYVLAKQHGITSPEEFGLLLVNHFTSKYPWVVKSKVSITAHPWERIADTQGQAHNHAFVSTPVAVRVANVEYARGGRPIVSAGLRELRILKTTQSAFTNFVSDEFRTLPDMDDRTFSTVVTADWTYGSLDSTLDFDAAYAKVLASVLEVFAGPADKVRRLIFKIFDFSISGNLFPVCAAFTASYPASCPAEGSSGGSDFHFDAECALLCCRLLQVHQNSWPQGLGCRGGVRPS